MKTNRIKKWTKKLSGDNRKRLYDLQKPDMVRKEKQATEDLVKIENQVKQIVQGESILYIPYYIIFGKEIYKLTRKFTALTLQNEACIRFVKWQARGLDTDVLNNILSLFSIDCEICVPFRLDISFLDGCDYLT